MGAIVAALLLFFKQTFAQAANLSNLSLMGVVFLANILVIMGIFTMFWVEVKLIPTLWILTAISPISFFIINRGLITADCSIGEVRTTKKQIN